MQFVRPTLLIDKQKCLKNLSRMMNKAGKHNLFFRPHFKTHQSLNTAEWFREAGVTAITVSSVRMANFFADHGWQDITIAFPVNLLELDEINRLAAKVHLNILIESKLVIAALEKSISEKIGIFIEIDTAYHRSGIMSDNFDKIEALIQEINPATFLSFKGFLTHGGNTYSASSEQEVLRIHNNNVQKLNELRNHFIGKYQELIVSMGDTPSCSISDEFLDIDEIRPGNFIYYDAMQYTIGSCTWDDIAVCVAAPVVAVYPEREELVVYCGAVHLSKEALKAKHLIYGYPVSLSNSGWQIIHGKNYVKSLSQEHGIIKLEKQNLDQFKVGDLIGILPVHSCLTANLLKDDSFVLK
jgi:D-serine deaminase-like pyridoxal phosphate-dependent protein